MIYLSFFNSSEGIVYNVDEMTGGLVISHRLRLPTRDYPGIFSADFLSNRKLFNDQ